MLLLLRGILIYPLFVSQTCDLWKDSFTVINRDALEVSPDDLPFAPNKLVSNLPYAVAATLVLDYFERFETIESQTIMVQAEVADRMCAQVGSKNYGAYTVKLSLFASYVGRFRLLKEISSHLPESKVLLLS